MTRIVGSITFFAAVATCAAIEQPLRVTLQQLVATPGKFDGRRVDVTGYYRASLEDSSLFVSAAAARHAVTHDQCIWLEPDIWDPRIHPHRRANVADVDQLRGHMVRVVGTFSYRPRREGWGDLWDRAIKKITYFQRVR